MKIRDSVSNSRSRRRSTLPIKDFDCPVVKAIGTLLCLPDTHHSELAELGKRADQMERDPFASRSVEVQAVQNCNVNQIIGRQPSVSGRFEIVGGIVPAWLS